MATKGKVKTGSAKDLVDVLRFIPRTYTIELTGYGGEIIIGKVKNETYEYYLENEIDIEDLVDDVDNEINIPDKHRIFKSGQWYECNNLCQEFGVEFSSSGTATVYDEHGNEVWSSSLDPSVLRNRGCRAELQNTFKTKNQPPRTKLFIGKSLETGTFFSGEIHLVTPFNPKKLGFGYVNIDSWNIGTGVEYNDEYIENLDTVTKATGAEFSLIEVEKFTKAHKLPMSSYEPDESEYSRYWAGNITPVHIGWYECIFKTEGHLSTTDRLLWDGNEWLMRRNERLIEVSDVKSWRGLVWDTTDMANRPSPVRREE
ncbi:MAG TPA: hypothetical protein VFM18_18705 [Methanosarcina sp.]|nr:hypothetical protein [Methanosarcina sp.]